ncbi:amidohydrolase 2 [Pholiota molesta]|nr:amidohydrolase 2 [Pholiota molesta]
MCLSRRIYFRKDVINLIIPNVSLICIVLFLAFLPCLSARKWRDTGTGFIVFEEAWTIPELINQTSSTTAAQGGTNAELKANLLDIHNQRLQGMDANNIDFMVLSCTQPCIQGISDPDAAAEMAVTVNNRLAAAISNNTERFGAFASLAMQNATIAAAELTRAVKMGFVGVLLNDYQQSGADGLTPLYYDQPEYDIFWKTLSDLDVPLYLHPRTDIPSILNFQYAHATFLKGPAQQFAATLSGHVLGICVNGVFDRFPKAKLIVGHFGERIPSDLVRIDTASKTTSLGLPMKKNVTTYWRENIFETSSGNFATGLLNFHIEQIGLNRIMYSIDYPFVCLLNSHCHPTMSTDQNI